MILYTSPFCPKCELAQKVLKDAGYTVSISKNTEKAIALGIKEAPCLVTDSDHRYGLKEIISICKGEGQFE